MVYLYLECPSYHIYRAIKTKLKYPRTCPYCGSSWSKRTTKTAYIFFRDNLWDTDKKRFFFNPR